MRNFYIVDLLKFNVYIERRIKTTWYDTVS